MTAKLMTKSPSSLPAVATITSSSAMCLATDSLPADSPWPRTANLDAQRPSEAPRCTVATATGRIAPQYQPSKRLAISSQAAISSSRKSTIEHTTADTGSTIIRQQTRQRLLANHPLLPRANHQHSYRRLLQPSAASYRVPSTLRPVHPNVCLNKPLLQSLFPRSVSRVIRP